MATPKKETTVKELTDKLSRTKSLVIADYQGLTHKQLEELRKALRKVEAELMITKNTLLKRALVETKKSVDDSLLNGATAALFSFADEVAPLAALVKFFKDNARGTIRGGLLGEQPLNEAEITRLSTLPSRDQLLAKLVGQLQSPIYGLHNALSWNLRQLVWTLSTIKDKKTN